MNQQKYSIQEQCYSEMDSESELTNNVEGTVLFKVQFHTDLACDASFKYGDRVMLAEILEN